MNYEPRPRHGLSPNVSPERPARISRFDYVVFTRADSLLAWKLFTDLERWPRFSNIYRSFSWKGAPWEVGSRLLTTLSDPDGTTTNRVITVCVPAQHVAWINHVRGCTMEQWVSFELFHDGGTKVSTWIEVTGSELSPDCGNILEYLKSILVQWFKNFAAEADRAATAPR